MEALGSFVALRVKFDAAAFWARGGFVRRQAIRPSTTTIPAPNRKLLRFFKFILISCVVRLTAWVGRFYGEGGGALPTSLAAGLGCHRKGLQHVRGEFGHRAHRGRTHQGTGNEFADDLLTHILELRPEFLHERDVHLVARPKLRRFFRRHRHFRCGSGWGAVRARGSRGGGVSVCAPVGRLSGPSGDWPRPASIAVEGVCDGFLGVWPELRRQERPDEIGLLIDGLLDEALLEVRSRTKLLGVLRQRHKLLA